MSDISSIMATLQGQPGELGHRVRRMIELRTALDQGDISADEFQELVRDLDKLDAVQLQAHELEQKILFNQVLAVLKNIPLG